MNTRAITQYILSLSKDTGTRVALGAVLLAVAYAFAAGVALANTTHTTSGTSGNHTDGTHYINPSHVSVELQSPVTSAS